MGLNILKNSASVLTRYKLRSFLMGLGVMIGVAVLVSGSLLGNGAENQLVQRVNQMFGPGTILVIGPSVKSSELEVLQRRLPNIVDWAPRFTVGEVEIQANNINRNALVYGHASNASYVWNRDVTEGRFFSKGDVALSARVALIGHKLAELHFGVESAIGQELLIEGDSFTIIGILEAAGIDPHGEDLDEIVFVPATTAMKRIRKSDTAGTYKIIVDDFEQVSALAEQVVQELREIRNIAQGQSNDFSVYSSAFAGQNAKNAFNTLKAYMALGAGTILLISAIVISSIMLAIVKDRVGEIGLRKAVGATEGQISAQFLMETAAISITFGLVGIVLGLGVSFGATAYLEMEILIQPGAIIMSLVASVVVGLLAGVLPARKAAFLDPTDALS